MHLLRIFFLHLLRIIYKNGNLSYLRSNYFSMKLDFFDKDRMP